VTEVGLSFCGVKLEPQPIEVFTYGEKTPDPAVVMPLVLDSTSDKVLCVQLNDGTIVGQKFAMLAEGIELQFAVTRAERRVDTSRPGEAVWSFWS
jgi:hypothetical protein